MDLLELQKDFVRSEILCAKDRYLVTYERGEGKNVVFLHGGASWWWSFRYQYMYLKDKIKIIAPNLRGHGGSPWKDTDRLEDFYLDLQEWFKNKDFQEPVMIVGHSLGGYLAVRYAVDNPQNVSKLVLISTSGSIRKGLARLFLETCWPAADIARRLLPFAVGLSSEMAGKLAKVIFPQWNCWDLYSQLNIPTLVLLGLFDPLISRNYGKRMLSLIPNSQLKFFFSGHNPQVSCGIQVARIIENFVLDTAIK